MKAHTANAATQRKRCIARTLGTAAAVGTLALLAVAGGPTGVFSGGTAEAVADAAPGYAVEDFNHPQADKILAERGITLKRGDGHIIYVDCASGTGFIEVWARRQDNTKICFKVTGNGGFLTMEIPSVHSIKGNDYTTEVDMTVDTERKTFQINKNAWTPVGESADAQEREHMLVEIRTVK